MIGMVLLTMSVGLACAFNTQAQRGAGKEPPPIMGAANYKLSGPYSHKNLTIFLVHGEDQMTGKPPLTLQEAMAQKKVIVHETSDVNQLAIENVSGEEVFVQSGDIVKGGKQDRTLAMDLIVPPKSGRVPIESFCVEQGRWSSRGGEATADFSLSEKMLASKELKLAAKARKSQSEVWANVAQAQSKLSENALIVRSEGPAGAGGNGIARATPVAEMRSAASPSSLQLTLENSELKQTVSEYLKQLAPVVAGKNNVIGYVFAINGKLNSADVYASRALFAKLWPKLLEASATEAIAEFKQDGKFEEVKTDEVTAFLSDAESGDSEEKKVTPRVRMIKRETERNLFFETRDQRQKDGWLHRNYITK
jgi:hypothetical protein